MVSKEATPETGSLLRLSEELEQRQAEADQLTQSFAPDDEIDAGWFAWWRIVERITATPATTAEALRSKAKAVRAVLVTTGNDRPAEATALLASLLADLLKEPVTLR